MMHAAWLTILALVLAAYLTFLKTREHVPSRESFGYVSSIANNGTFQNVGDWLSKGPAVSSWGKVNPTGGWLGAGTPPSGAVPRFPTLTGPAVLFYEHADYKGKRTDLGIGSYPQLWSVNDTFSSAIVAPGLKVTFYKDSNFKGVAGVFTAGYIPNVGAYWNDTISSAVVSSA